MTAESGRDRHAVANPDGETLYGLIAGMARRASDSRLALACGAGLLGVGLIGIFAPGRWRLALPLICLASFGGWGVADRERTARGARGTALAIVRVLAAIAGTTAALLIGGLAMAKVIGTWIS